MSHYDHIIQRYAKNINWDWRLVQPLLSIKNPGLILMQEAGAVHKD